MKYVTFLKRVKISTSLSSEIVYGDVGAESDWRLTCDPRFGENAEISQKNADEELKIHAQ